MALSKTDLLQIISCSMQLRHQLLHGGGLWATGPAEDQGPRETGDVGGYDTST